MRHLQGGGLRARAQYEGRHSRVERSGRPERPEVLARIRGALLQTNGHAGRKDRPDLNVDPYELGTPSRWDLKIDLCKSRDEAGGRSGVQDRCEFASKRVTHADPLQNRGGEARWNNLPIGDGWIVGTCTR